MGGSSRQVEFAGMIAQEIGSLSDVEHQADEGGKDLLIGLGDPRKDLGNSEHFQDLQEADRNGESTPLRRLVRSQEKKMRETWEPTSLSTATQELPYREGRRDAQMKKRKRRPGGNEEMRTRAKLQTQNELLQREGPGALEAAGERKEYWGFRKGVGGEIPRRSTRGERVSIHQTT